MARIPVLLLIAFLAGAGRAGAQSRVYLSATAAVEGGDRAIVPGDAVPVAGGLIGVRLTEAWGLELEIDRGWRTTTAGSGEAVIWSYPPSANATRDEIERYGVRAQSDRTQRASTGWSALAAWRSRAAGRVNLQVMVGVSSRVYETTLKRKTTFVSPLLNLPPDYHDPDETSARRLVAGGPAGGVALLVRVTDHVTIAPEFRIATGVITDDPYRIGRAGVRTTWVF